MTPSDAWRGLRDVTAALRPAPLAIDARERLRFMLGAALGLLAAGVLSGLLPHEVASPWLVAPLGASAVLVFGLPASPLAQPWAVVGGNTVSALLGVGCAVAGQRLGLPVPLIAAAAVGSAIGLMLLLRCLHPPGGAAALLAILSQASSGHTPDWHFAVYPVLANSLLLVAAGMVYNPLTGRRYPHGQRDAAPAAAPQPGVPGVPGMRDVVTDADLDAVLQRYNQVLDVPRDDLRALLSAAELHAYERQLGAVRCGDIMSREVVTVEFGTPLDEAWSLLRQHRIKALPVVDRWRHITGIVTLADFMRAAAIDRHDGLADKLRGLIRRTPGDASDKPEVVGQIMSRTVRVASEHRPLAELVPIFSSTGHHHIPILGADGKLAGIVTQSDLVAALTRPG